MFHIKHRFIFWHQKPALFLVSLVSFYVGAACSKAGRVMTSMSVFLFLLLTNVTLKAQLNSNITRYTTENGLSHDGILSITRDKEGFMWFGTWDGINRFDGHDFVVYKSRPGDASNLKNNKIRNIVEDKDAYLWVETYDNKIYRFNKKTEQFLPLSDGTYRHLFQDVVISRIIPDHNGGVWLLTQNHGALYASGGSSADPTILPYHKKAVGGFKISGNQVSFLIRDSLNNIWMGTENGLSRLKSTRKCYVNVPFNSRDSKLISSHSFTCATQKGSLLFFGTADGTLITYNLQTGTFREILLSKGTRLNAICNGRSGFLYISTKGKGLVTLDPQSSKFKFQGLSPTDTYHSLYEDGSGQIWIEPEAKGIVKYNPQNK
ncbi:ligand-binding sensor domain-containing protein, partial [Pedobacter sp.]|uniref:ligand-binding sensor domain-containing protein n=1 Tax=Pedobacter sp. TaxID=1411316 RepID=UPI003D7F9F3E